MTTLIATTVSPRETPAPGPTVEIAGVDWPLYKLQAVIVGVLAAVLVAGVTQSGVLTAWTLTITSVVTWWARRAACARAGQG